MKLRLFEQEDEIIFIVSDDGVGMSDEKIEDILAGRTVTGKSGFGLYSLIQRIQSYIRNRKSCNYTK
ncbi:MAG: sensor histidine kinase [Ruminococcus sp.]